MGQVCYRVSISLFKEADDIGIQSVAVGEFGDMTKIDTLRVIAASHVILAVVLIGILCLNCTNIGVLLLQGGQWYAELAALRELNEMEANELEEDKKSQ